MAENDQTIYFILETDILRIKFKYLNGGEYQWKRMQRNLSP